MASALRTALRICPLCEAGCGLEVSLRGGDVVRIRGDMEDVFSHGYICPKGSTLKQLHEDPDRLRVPLVRSGGTLREATWDEAFAAAAGGLRAVAEAQGRNAVAVYLGNPNAHTLSGSFYVKPLVKGLGTRNVFTASTVDQRPKEISAGLMFGTGLSIPIPDIDRTDHLLILGANPYASNGSLATAPDWPGRLERLRARGGRLVVVDPRRSRTAEEADEHVAVRPGGDAHLLMGMVHVLFDEGLVSLGGAEPFVAGVDDVARASRPFTPEAVAGAAGVDAAVIRRLARELAAAPTAAVYGRIGTTTVAFGTLTSWLVDVLNTLTGNLDRPGGAMFTTPAAGSPTTRGRPRYGRGVRLGRWGSRVRGLPETFGELPAVCLAEEIDTPGEGQVRALVTVAGNPVLSTPNSGRLDAALAGLEFMVSVDPYVNETTRHADVILPGPSQLQRGHYDVFLSALAIRNVAHYTPPVLPLDDGAPDEWEILARLAGGEPDAVTDGILAEMVQAALTDDMSPLHGRDPSEVTGLLGGRRGPERILDLMLRTGPYRLTLDDLLAAPHGLDHRPLVPRLPDVLRTPSGMAELAPEPLIADVARLEAALDGGGAPVGGEAGFVLVGRRHLRSNNSWMHNVKVLVKGKPRCTLQVHPDDADRLGLADGDPADVTSRTGKLTAPVEVTDSIRPGVVSLPHGWGHNVPGVVLAVASEHAGVNSNLLADEEAFDPLSGNAVLNGIPVQVNRVAS
ncbi:MAG TPA: molybdopterin oxidoreductase family protein [Acidimicrobiia bacterium]|nr:molybdopterin oxidoreductase family protein [Acidimicrobiia bacterium]